MRLLKLFVSACLAFTCISASVIEARTPGQLTQVTSFGSNPSNTLMYIYVPVKLVTKPALIVAIHYCGGTAAAYASGSPYTQLAEQYGFIVIFPQSPYSGTCWDVSSTSALTHNGGGDSNSIANMVTYAISTYGVDSTRVFVTGSSSGAMMTASQKIQSILHSNLLISSKERHGSNIPRDVRRRNRLLWCPRWLLREFHQPS